MDGLLSSPAPSKGGGKSSPFLCSTATGILIGIMRNILVFRFGFSRRARHLMFFGWGLLRSAFYYRNDRRYSFSFLDKWGLRPCDSRRLDSWCSPLCFLSRLNLRLFPLGH